MNSQVSRSALRKRRQDASNVTVALVGLDRVSGSLGLALRGVNERPETDLVFTVLGRDLDNEAMKSAQRIGAVDNFNRTMQRVVEAAAIVVVNVPLGELEETLARLGELMEPGTVVIDLSPLKSPGVKFASQHFPKDADGKPTIYLVGATPLIGFDQLYTTDLTVESSQEFLFRGNDMLVAPDATVPPEAIKVVTDIAALLGMKPRFMDPAEHDGLASLTEDMPVVLSLLMLDLVRQSPGKLDVLRATNSRFASAVQNLRTFSDQDIALMLNANKSSLKQHIEQLMLNLEAFHKLLSDPEPLVLQAYLKQVLDAFVTWEVQREKNRWDEPGQDTMDNIQATGIPIVGQIFGGRRRQDED